MVGARATQGEAQASIQRAIGLTKDSALTRDESARGLRPPGASKLQEGPGVFPGMTRYVALPFKRRNLDEPGDRLPDGSFPTSEEGLRIWLKSRRGRPFSRGRKPPLEADWIVYCWAERNPWHAVGLSGFEVLGRGGRKPPGWRIRAKKTRVFKAPSRLSKPTEPGQRFLWLTAAQVEQLSSE